MHRKRAQPITNLHHLEQQPLVDLIGEENLDKLKATGSDGLRICYSVLMRSNVNDVNQCIAKLISKFNEKGKWFD